MQACVVCLQGSWCMHWVQVDHSMHVG